MGHKRDWALKLCGITEVNGVPCICTRRKLKLPAVQPNTQISLEEFDETSSGAGFPSALRRPSTLPFRVPPSDSVLAFYVRAHSCSGEKQALLFFSVFTSTLRRFTVERGGIFINVPWKKWGPELTRWINVEGSPMMRALSETQCVISDTRAGQVHMLDFNPERLTWMKDWIKRGTGETEGRDWSVMVSPTTILAGKGFKHNIESKLPYYELRKTRDLHEEGKVRFLIDENWVILIRVCSNHYNVANIRLIF
jgi:hypothetical protein